MTLKQWFCELRLDEWRQSGGGRVVVVHICFELYWVPGSGGGAAAPPKHNLKLRSWLGNLFTVVTFFSDVVLFGMFFMFTVIVVGGLGNLCTVATILHQRFLPARLRHIPKMTSSVILILNLAITDGLYCLLNLPVILQVYIIIYRSSGVSICVNIVFFLLQLL